MGETDWGGKGLVVMGRAMLSKFLIQFSVEMEKERATHSSTLAWRIPWMGSQGVGQDWVTSLSLSVAGRCCVPCCLTWGQTTVDQMKIMVTSFKRSHAGTATLSAPNPGPAGHHRLTLPSETPGHSWASLSQSLLLSLLPSSGSWCAQGFVCVLQESVSQSCVSSCGSMVGLMATSFERAYASRSASS